MNQIKYNILLIDDHPVIVEAYKLALNRIENEKNTQIDFSIKTAINCDEAIVIIENFYSSKQKLDLVFLDISLPASSDKSILSGEDLGIKINTLLPKSKIIVSTTFNDNYRIYSIFKSLNPDGFIIKNDINSKQIVEAIKLVLNNEPYYSKTVTKLLRSEVSNDFVIDHIDRMILYEISIGTLTKNLSKTIPLSKAGIEKRKRLLKEIFNIQGSEDRELILAAKDKGFI